MPTSTGECLLDDGSADMIVMASGDDGLELQQS